MYVPEQYMYTEYAIAKVHFAANKAELCELLPFEQTKQHGRHFVRVVDTGCCVQRFQHYADSVVRNICFLCARS